jgi:hypothetical protein
MYVQKTWLVSFLGALYSAYHFFAQFLLKNCPFTPHFAFEVYFLTPKLQKCASPPPTHSDSVFFHGPHQPSQSMNFSEIGPSSVCANHKASKKNWSEWCDVIDFETLSDFPSEIWNHPPAHAPIIAMPKVNPPYRVLTK